LRYGSSSAPDADLVQLAAVEVAGVVPVAAVATERWQVVGASDAHWILRKRFNVGAF
jgi:hypothetical protein